MTTARAASLADAEAVTALRRSVEQQLLGAPETGESEVREQLGRAAATRLVEDGGVPRGFASVWGKGEADLVVDPSAAGRPETARQLLAWLRTAEAQEVEVLGSDEQLVAVVEGAGWQRSVSAFELLRDASALEPPRWPAGTTLTGLHVERHGPAVHALVYDAAGWAEVVGHHHRPYAQWLQMLAYDGYDPDQQVVAWQDGTPVGVATGQVFSDGTGWIQQLAVARVARGQGLGRALLLTGLQNRLDAGATQLGLSVQADNAAALGLYTGVGLAVDREWVRYLAP